MALSASMFHELREIPAMSEGWVILGTCTSEDTVKLSKFQLLGAKSSTSNFVTR